MPKMVTLYVCNHKENERAQHVLIRLRSGKARLWLAAQLPTARPPGSALLGACPHLGLCPRLDPGRGCSGATSLHPAGP